MAALKVEIYINEKPIEEYEPEELEEIKVKLTRKAMAAIGFVPLAEENCTSSSAKESRKRS